VLSLQLNLLTRLGPRAEESRRGPVSTVPGAWHDSAISQLDAIVATNEHLAAQAWRRRAVWVATLVAAALLVLVSLWRPARDEPSLHTSALAAPRAPVSVAAGAAPAGQAPIAVNMMAVTTRVAPTPVVSAPTATRPVVSTASAAPLAMAGAVPVVATPIDEAARKARAVKITEARRKAAELARARAVDEEDAQRRQRVQEQQDSELEQQLAQATRQRAAAAERSRLQAIQLARETHRSVRETCSAAGGFIGEQLCHSRECRKPEQQGDPVCVRLHDIEMARLRTSADQ